MNEIILPVILIVVTLAFAGGWYVSVADNRRLRAKNEDLNDSLLSAIGELAQVKERARNLEDAKAAMSEHFKAASFQAMEQTADGLLKRAEESFVAREKLALERMDSSLKPVSETLTRFEAQVKAMEENRHKDTGGLKQQIEHLMTASTATRDVTAKLANALRRGAGVQGRWGEETLRNVLQAAGLTRFDFTEQHNLDTEEGRRRPDVTVKLPGGVFVIDAKVNLTAFLEAMEAVDDEAREMHLMRHARALQTHVRDLSQKAYWDQFKDASPDFVAMFIPGDGFLASALERLPNLMNEAMDRKVIIVTPTTLFALCKAVAYGWRVEDQMKNAQSVAELGRELYARLSVMGGHVADLGKSLNTAVGKYNQFVGSLETKVLTQARRFEDLSVDHEGKTLPELNQLEVQTKLLNKLESSSVE
ncbi:DNA recombination protein RmuC [Asticcacaulis sp. SL142]|jgi:DNA recombination protein RmuC|uniref:DNA recombination protein RmuC n=1 Tax=Asticcacaulis sp. SL142 TaxID=2995155 RepID=UPI00226D0D4F|nr:DNA recombination protein RmuC [Asticcacaulis sp. SL142]WAC47819.1 DNA recombination protein RmuC [Asticcacaulis sp. SL142]